MKRLYVIFLIILLFPVANAEEFSEYKNLDLTFYFGSNLSIIKLNGDSKIDYASVDVLLLPKDEKTLKIYNLEHVSDPQAEVNLNHKATFSWNKINTSSLRFGLISKVNINNDFIKVKKKIEFPTINEENTEYTLPTKFIDLNEGIVNKAHELVEGEEDLYSAVFKIAEWTRVNIKYDLNTLTEKAVQKSSWVYENRNGVCDEITNLFISMVRSVGIPARFVSGTVYSTSINDWGSHGWAEVYFPNYGWVPFDVTFGQYGWVDPSHLKLSDTPDSGENSIEFNWRSRDVDLDIEPIYMSTKLDKLGEKFEPLIELKINTLTDNKFAFGSYIPIEVSATNLNDYYLSSVIVLTKSPELIGENFKDILLKPKETKNYYFLGRFQNNLSNKYEYTGIIEVKDSFGSKSFYNVLLKENYNSVSLEQARDLINKVNKREEKKISASLNLDCKTEKEIYYSDEEIGIECKVKNKGNILLKDVNTCLRSKCFTNDLKINEEQTYKFNVLNEKKVTILAETDDLISKNILLIDVIQVPEIFISGITPDKINYNEKARLKFTLNSNVPAYNLSLFVNDEIYDYKEINGEKDVYLDILGSDLVYGLDMKLWYFDKKGNKYIKEFSFDIDISESPWYVKLIKVLTFSK